MDYFLLNVLPTMSIEHLMALGLAILAFPTFVRIFFGMMDFLIGAYLGK